MSSEQKKHNFDFLAQLYAQIEDRKKEFDNGQISSNSYTHELLQAGRKRTAQKLGEEAVELVIEAQHDDSALQIAESADLLYHLLVLWAERGITPENIMQELQDRHAK